MSDLPCLNPAQRQVDFEHPFVRFIHLLAHHPDFEGQADDVQEMKEMAKYVARSRCWTFD